MTAYREYVKKRLTGFKGNVREEMKKIGKEWKEIKGKGIGVPFPPIPIPDEKKRSHVPIPQGEVQGGRVYKGKGDSWQLPHIALSR
jgi:hypothetical protein